MSERIERAAERAALRRASSSRSPRCANDSPGSGSAIKHDRDELPGGGEGQSDSRHAMSARLANRANALAQAAVAADSAGDHESALGQYRQAVHFMTLVLHVQRGVDTPDSISQFIELYQKRIARLVNAPKASHMVQMHASSPPAASGAIDAPLPPEAPAAAVDEGVPDEPTVTTPHRSQGEATCGCIGLVGGASPSSRRKSHAEAGHHLFSSLALAQEHLDSTEQMHSEMLEILDGV